MLTEGTFGTGIEALGNAIARMGERIGVGNEIAKSAWYGQSNLLIGLGNGIGNVNTNIMHGFGDTTNLLKQIVTNTWGLGTNLASGFGNTTNLLTNVVGLLSNMLGRGTGSSNWTSNVPGWMGDASNRAAAASSEGRGYFGSISNGVTSPSKATDLGDEWLVIPIVIGSYSTNLDCRLSANSLLGPALPWIRRLEIWGIAIFVLIWLTRTTVKYVDRLARTGQTDMSLARASLGVFEEVPGVGAGAVISYRIVLGSAIAVILGWFPVAMYGFWSDRSGLFGLLAANPLGGDIGGTIAKPKKFRYSFRNTAPTPYPTQRSP
jgi:hypothetical protein